MNRSRKAILITGGCGYIGSHVTRQLSEAGYSPIVLDNLSTGFREALIHGETLVCADLADVDGTSATLQDHGITTVMHFAASIVAPESVKKPLDYYQNNVVNTLNLLLACKRADVKNVIYSSTAAVYGIPEVGIASEDTPAIPINPYGSSKLMGERMIEDLSMATGMTFVILRYFNVAGADPQARMGQRIQSSTHLLKACCNAALGKQKMVSIFGTDYPTKDGTAVRDYIHVEDLAKAHLDALAYLEQSGPSVILNVGYGKGFTVRDIVEMMRKVTGIPIEAVATSRRAGDPPMLVTSADKIRKTLGWAPRFDDLEKIVADTWRWEQQMKR